MHHGCAASHSQRAFHRFDDLRIYFHARTQRAEFTVKNLPHQRRVTKDASDHGHRDGSGLSFREEAANHHRGDLRQFRARMAENLCGQVI